MDIAEYASQIERHTDRLATAAATAGLDETVPSCPGWTVRDLVIHVGGVHRWAADLVANARLEFGTDAAAAVGTGPEDDRLLTWLQDGSRSLTEVLRTAPADINCFTMWPSDQPLHFWSRRQAHETAIHRADADAAAGVATGYDEDFAIDGIAEMLEGFARRKKPIEATVIDLEAAGTTRRLEMGAAGITVTEGALGAPDAVVSGTASEVYLWLWNRPSNATISGDPAAAQRWQQIRVRWS